ncbi:hypothetical protein OEZ86_003062 [Tetradesmus obliquus]|nr:hypothetical protein OEZ86_003062 [Tetradesmus obliquus]
MSISAGTKSLSCHRNKSYQSCSALPGLGQLFRRISGQSSQPLDLVDSQPELLQWLQERQYDACKQKLVTQELPGQGRGLVANAAVRKGELLLAVPQQLIIFPETAAAESCLAPLLSQPQQLSDWSLLALFLAEQLYLCDRAGGSSSSAAWAPYIGVLPRNPIGTVLDWSQKDVDTLLAGSGLASTAAMIRIGAQLVWQDLQPLLTAATQQGLCPADMFSKADIYWAIGICMSRSVRLADRGDQVVLVPFADLLNHEPSCEAYLLWEEQQQAVVLRPDRDYSPGQQVFISYGPKSSGELLLSYGFCPPAGSNPHDAAHLSFNLQDSDPWLQAKQQALQRQGKASSESFALRIDGLPAELLPFLALCAAQPQSAAEVEALADELFAGRWPSIGGVSCEQLALEMLAKACKAALKGYPQQAEADRQLAAAGQAGGGFAHRRELMAAVRVRERQILSRTGFVAQQRIRQLRKGA